MDDVIGNLGEPLDFEGDEVVLDDTFSQNADVEQKDVEDKAQRDCRSTSRLEST